MTRAAELEAVPQLDIKHTVVRAVLPNRLGQVVLLQRLSTKGYHRDHYEFPGGKIEAGEDPMDALVREVWEETGLTVELLIGPRDRVIVMTRLMQDIGKYIRTTTVCGRIVGGQCTYDPDEHQRLIVATPSEAMQTLLLTDECRHAMAEFGMVGPEQQAA